jgi:hypothetical protein
LAIPRSNATDKTMMMFWAVRSERMGIKVFFESLESTQFYKLIIKVQSIDLFI